MTETKKTALVTGASRGIGSEIAKRLAQDGFFVYLNSTKRNENAERVEKEIHAAGGACEILPFDITDSAAVDGAFETITKKTGALSVLVNNAGVNCDGLIVRLKNEEIDRILDTNVKGAIYCTRQASQQMMRARKGSIIFISSVVGETGNAGQSVYAATKSALFGFSKSVAKELASRQVRSNVVTPGFIQTEMTEVLTSTQKEAILRQIPMSTLGHPQDVAAVCAFLASDESRYITGQIIGVNGGMFM